MTILCYDSNGDFYKEFPSILKASQELSIPTGNISKFVRGVDNSHSCYGFYFMKKESDNYPLKIEYLLK
jgi:hypothetical protein